MAKLFTNKIRSVKNITKARKVIRPVRIVRSFGESLLFFSILSMKNLPTGTLISHSFLKTHGIAVINNHSVNRTALFAIMPKVELEFDFEELMSMCVLEVSKYIISYKNIKVNIIKNPY